MMRVVSERISQWSCGRYFFFWCGDELLMDANNDGDAIIEGKNLLAELEAE
jgi:hypothetical protein